MADVLGFAEVNDFLGDVLGVVGDAFEAFGGDDPMQAAPDGVWVFHHVLGEDSMNLLVERVHFLVARDDGACGDGIALHKGVERVLDHGEGEGGHAREVEVDLDGRFLGQVAGALGDLGGLVADALEVLGNFHGHGH